MPTSANVTTRVKTIDANSAAEAAFELLRRCRRRLVVVAAVRRAGVTLPIAIALSETIALVARPAPLVLWTVVAAAIGLALIAALGAALVSAPSLRDTAAALDARLRLQDRMVTALQVAADDDPMATLVLRDVAFRIAGVSPSQTFPLEPPAHFRAIGVAAIVISTGLRRRERHLARVANRPRAPGWLAGHRRCAEKSRRAVPKHNSLPQTPRLLLQVRVPSARLRLRHAPPNRQWDAISAGHRQGLKAAAPRRGSDAASSPAGREVPGAHGARRWGGSRPWRGRRVDGIGTGRRRGQRRVVAERGRCGRR